MLSSPELPRVGVVVVVDVRDDLFEHDEAGFFWELDGSSGYAEGCLLLKSNGPAATQRKETKVLFVRLLPVERATFESLHCVT